MSEPVPTPPNSSEPKLEAAPAKKPGKWRRRWKRIFLVLFVVAILFRIVLFYAIRPVLRKVGEAYNVNITFDRQEMTLSAADVGFWYLKVTPKSGGQPLLAADYIRGRISLWDLVHGRLHVLRSEVDGMDIFLERTKDGRIPVLEQILAKQATAAPKASTAQPQNIDFTSPLKVDAFRLEHVRARIRDAFVDPPLDALVAMDVRVSNLGQIDHPVLFEIDMWSDPVLDLMRVYGQATNNARDLDATVGVFVRGFHPKPLAGYLAAFGIRPTENDLALKLSASVKTESAAAPSKGVKATLQVDRMDVISESQPVVSVHNVHVEATDVQPTAAQINSVVISGVRARAARGTNGLLRVAGFELIGGAKSSPTSPPSTSSPYQLTIGEVSVRDVQANFRDEGVSPANDLTFNLSEVGSKGSNLDPNNPETVMPLAGSMSLPGIAQSITLNGTLKPFSETKTLELAFVVDGIKPDLAKPYLTPAGIESLLKNGHAEGRLHATLRANDVDAQITGLRFADGTDLIAMPEVKITSVGPDDARGRLKIQSIELTGPSLDVTRDAEGRIVVAGIRYSPTHPPSHSVTPGAATSAPVAPSTNPSLAQSLPRIEIGTLAWKSLRLHLRDEQMQPPSVIAIDDMRVDGKDLLIDLTSETDAKPGTLKLLLRDSSIAKTLSLDATLHPGKNKLAADFAVRGEGLNTAVLAPYLTPLGIEPTMRSGAVQLDGHVALARDPDRLGALLDLSGVKLSDSGKELAGFDQLQLADLSLMNNGSIDLKSLSVKKPRITITREANGALAAAGIRLLATTQPAQPSIVSAPATKATTASSPAPSPIVNVGDVKVEDAQIALIDHMAREPVQLEAHANVQASKVVLGKAAPPAAFRAVLSVDGMLDELVAAGRLDATPNAPSLIAAIEGKGIRCGPIESYLPPGIELTTKDGRFKASIEAGIAKNPKGGNSAKLLVQNVDWRDGELGDPLFAFDTFKVTAPRIDPAGDVIAVDEVSLTGLQTHAELDKDGITHALGLTIGRAPKTSSLATSPAAPAPATPIASTTEASDVGELVARARRPLPLITLQKLDLNVRSAAVRNLGTPDAAPLVLQDVALRNEAPIEMGGKDAANGPPVKIALTGKISPVVGSFQVALAGTPFTTSPAGTIEINAAGIRGDGVTELLPALREQLKGQELVDGRFHTSIQAQVKYDRRGLRDFDLSRGFTLDTLIDDITFRSRESGPVLAGLESVRADQVQVKPKIGTVIAKVIEVSKPQLRATREKDGIHTLGFIIPLSTTQPTTKPSEEAVAQAPPSPPVEATPSPTTKPTGEVRVDRLTLSGVDVRVEDHTVDPVMIVPLNNMDLEVRDFTTLAFVEPRTMRFSMLLNADKVPLPVPPKAGGGVVGLLGDIGKQKAETPTTRQFEQREMLSQISTSGQIAFYPKPHGYIKTTISGVELASFEGAARQAGVELSGGVFDGNIDVRFEDTGNMETKSKFVLTDLQLVEAENGPIRQGLGLSVPLDIAQKAVRDPSGSITIPLNVPIKNGELSMSTLESAGMGAIAQVVMTGVASAPIKIGATALDVVGVGSLFGGKKKPPEPVVIAFSPGAAELDASARQQLAALVEQLQRDDKSQVTIRHELGPADVAIAQLRANPSPEDCTALISRLRARKEALSEERSRLASQVRAQLAALSAKQTAPAVDQLRDLDRQIAECETSVDQLYELLRPGADRQAPRRTRAACLQIGDARLSAIKAELVAGKIENAATRIVVTSSQYNPLPQDPGKITIVLMNQKK